ncbi:MAG: ABC transporter substrate-binding protein, partial [Bacteroidota bacterium]
MQLNGITWNHSRGFTSIVAAAQRFQELNPSVEINWSKRSLQAFADQPINELAQQFDLLIIDHPWAGFAAKTASIVALDKYLDATFLKDQANNSVGHSHISYAYNEHQWAIAIDAATPVAASRPDLLDRFQLKLPKNWEELVALSKEGYVAIPGIPQDTLMSFYMLCSTLGEDVCTTDQYVISAEVGLLALEHLRELGQYINKDCYSMNPIQVYEAMTLTDQYAYSPFAYGYANYARKGFARKLLQFHDLLSINDKALITTLGGTGLAISSHCNHMEWAAKFVSFAGSKEIQKGIFFDSGGQPGHRAAWEDSYTNFISGDYFKKTLPALDRAFLRPRYHGHMFFQDHA